MTLVEIRAEFLKLSGRHDLVNDDGTNNGADFYINAGLRMLNNMVTDEIATENTELVDEADDCFWTINYPDTAVYASLCRLESSYRNTTGARDWLETIMRDLTNLDMEYIEEQIADLDAMEG